ncbi:Hypothetical_protein [Hexamita inflata]|uniref:Hypothetical_protein n=1 Tax=Hexamita inflata TaxID=28002 RepID=A0AA86RR74_9EUKA|nr:Hypothetical protein HINF_LOCUS65768 [Hexamita inflata]
MADADPDWCIRSRRQSRPSPRHCVIRSQIWTRTARSFYVQVIQRRESVTETFHQIIQIPTNRVSEDDVGDLTASLSSLPFPQYFKRELQYLVYRDRHFFRYRDRRRLLIEPAKKSIS